MIALQQRRSLLPLIQEACNGGVRFARACLQIGLFARTVQRWLRPQRQDGDPVAMTQCNRLISPRVTC